MAEDAYDSVKGRKEAGRIYERVMDFRHHYPEYMGKPERFWIWILKYTCCYGESITRFLIWIFAIVTFFAFIYIPFDYRCWAASQMPLRLSFAVLLLSAILLTSVINRWRRLRKAFIAAFVAIMFASFLSPFAHVSDVFASNGVRFNNIVRGFYFSFTTFSTFGLGDIAPLNTVAATVACFEVLFGYLLFGVLLTLLARKIMR